MFTDYIPLIGAFLLFLGTAVSAYKGVTAAKAQADVQRQANQAGSQNNRYDQIQEDLDAERKQNETLRDRVDKMSGRMDTMEQENQKLRSKFTIAMTVIQQQQDHARRAGIVPMEIPALLTSI